MGFFSPPRPKLTLGTYRYGFPILPGRVELDEARMNTHTHQMGLTGVGKSKLNESRFMQLLSQGIGVSLLDPHSDSAEAILASLVASGFFERPDAFDRLLYVEFCDPGERRFLSFNVLEQPHLKPHDIAANVLESLHRAWPALSDGSAPVFDNLILGGTLTLVENGLPLPVLHRLLTDRPFRDGLLGNVSDPDVVAFFHDRFDRWSRTEVAQLVESTLRRVFLVSFAPILKYSLGQTENALDFRRIMDSSQAVIYNLGQVQDPTARRLLGCLISTGYEMAALSRQDVDPSQRPVHHMILDEFAEFSAQTEESLAGILSQTRKYGLFLTLSHQTWNQAARKLQSALQNVGVRIAFQLGREDAELLAKAFGTIDPYQVKSEARSPTGQPVFLETQAQWEEWIKTLMELPPRVALVRIPGKPAVQIKTLTVPTPRIAPDAVEAVKQTYRDRLLRPREEVAAGHQTVERPVPLARTAPLPPKRSSG